eukprot:gene30505-21799_t
MMAMHELTAALASSASVAQLKQAGIQALEAVSTSRDGTVTVKVKAGSASGYGACWWDVRVGGEGQGADEDVAWGGHPRGPVLVKFMQPYFHMPGVDDAGVCDGSFWEGMAMPPTLQAITLRVVVWLEGKHLAPLLEGGSGSSDGNGGGDDLMKAFLEAEKHTAGK